MTHWINLDNSLLYSLQKHGTLNVHVKICRANFPNISSRCISQWKEHRASSHWVHTFPSEAGSGESQLRWYKLALQLSHSPHIVSSATKPKRTGRSNNANHMQCKPYVDKHWNWRNQIATVLVFEFMSKRRQVTFPTFYIYSGFHIKAAEKSSTKSTSLCCLLNEM